MPILPIIDLLIFSGWSMLTIGAVLKGVYVTTHYRPTLFTLTPMECLMVAGMFLLFALTLAARTWVKANDPGVLARGRAATTLEAYKLTQAKVKQDESEVEDPDAGARAEGSIAGRLRSR